MEYLIISDAHGDRSILEKIVNAYRGKVRAMFYNGDSELDASDELFNDLMPVIGNMDYDEMFPADCDYQDSELSLYQTHGHFYHTEMDLNRLREAVASKPATVVTSGHTHVIGAEMIDGRLFINPGSIALPKGPYAYLGGTYAILTVTPAMYQVTYYHRDMTPVAGFSFTFKK
ncbi:YfcE family phosphodiesterase [Weissella soli]|uniref:YfcE family phosphodiesterase n=2 Tax=Weissella soli TaxID=155866 RepID=UPI0035A12FCA